MNNKNEGLEPLIFDTPEMRSKFINGDNAKIEVNETPISPIEFDVRTKDFEEKIYIILYKINTDEDESMYRNIYSVCIGRTEAYNDIKEKLISGIDVDIHRSLIMTETKQTESKSGDRKYFMMHYNDLISLYSFCISVKEFYNAIDGDFDIEDYNNTDVPEDMHSEVRNNNFLTQEQLEYRRLLEQSIKRDKFINNLRKEVNNVETHNI